MKTAKLVILFFIIATNSLAQDTSKSKIKALDFTLGTFNTLSAGHTVTVNPAISGYLGDYYFENRYNYEANNSASLNVGRRIFRKLKNFEIIPMAGFVFGSFKGITAELQTSFDSRKWALSTDNQFSFEYKQPGKSLYLNWSVARFKLTKAFRIGFTTVVTKQLNQGTIFDKGLTAAVLFKQWGLRFYGFNAEKSKRYYWLSVRYNIRVKLNGR